MNNSSPDACVQQQKTLEVEGIAYVELYVGNSRQAAYFLHTAFGFTPVAYAGQETGVQDRMSYVLEQGDATVVLTAPLDQHSPIAQHVQLHSDGVKDIAFRVQDATSSFEEAVKRGARVVMEPMELEDEKGRVITATIGTFGDTVHTFVQRDEYTGIFSPAYRPIKSVHPALSPKVIGLDHLGISVEAGTLDQWVDYYRQVFGFHLVHQESIATAHTAMHSKVVQNRSGTVKFPMQEPAPGRRKSQIEEYLASYCGSGVQHLALLTSNIIQTTRMLRENGLEFLYTPETYYQTLGDRIGKIEESIDDLQAEHILVDRDEWGYLLQIFSKPIQSRPTVFLELIQRNNARGFGSGNIKALFEAIEREQMLRGVL